MKSTAQEWDSIWSSESVMHRTLNRVREMFTRSIYNKVFKELINSNTVMLEVGCGSSTTSLFLCPKIRNFVGLDISKEAIELSSKKAKELKIGNAEFVKGDCFSMPFKKGSVDIVWSQGLIEHFDNPEDIMSEKVRVCKKGGYVITSVPALWSYQKVWYVLTRPRFLRSLWPWTEQVFYTKKKLKKVINRNKVDIMKTRYMHEFGVIVQTAKKL